MLSPQVKEWIEKQKFDPAVYVMRHRFGDCGEELPYDQIFEALDAYITGKGMVGSRFTTPLGSLFVATNAERTQTYVGTPDEVGMNEAAG